RGGHAVRGLLCREKLAVRVIHRGDERRDRGIVLVYLATSWSVGGHDDDVTRLLKRAGELVEHAEGSMGRMWLKDRPDRRLEMSARRGQRGPDRGRMVRVVVDD